MTANGITFAAANLAGFSAAFSQSPSRDDGAWREAGKLIFAAPCDCEEDGRSIKVTGDGGESAMANRTPHHEQVEINGVNVFKGASARPGNAGPQYSWAFFKSRMDLGAGRHIVFITGVGLFATASYDESQATPDRRLVVGPEKRASPQSKEKAAPWQAGNEWHDLTLAFGGDEMRLSIDGELVASHGAEGFAHPMKRWLSFSASNTV